MLKAIVRIFRLLRTLMVLAPLCVGGWVLLAPATTAERARLGPNPEPGTLRADRVTQIIGFYANRAAAFLPNAATQNSDILTAIQNGALENDFPNLGLPTTAPAPSGGAKFIQVTPRDQTQTTP